MSFDYRRVHTFYEEFLAEHHDDARKVAWRTRFDQELRFENLLEALDDDGRPFTLLDVGCGLGDLFGYLRATGRNADYLGIDIVPDMVERARMRHPEGRFEVLDLIAQTPPGRFDLVVASGSLTVRVPKHELFVDKMLRQMLAVSDGAVAINFQSTRSFRQNPLAAEDPDLFHVDPMAIYATCRRLCRWTTLREDMLTSDLVIYLYPRYARSVQRYHRVADADPEGVAWLYLERHLPEKALEVLVDATSAAAENLRGMAFHRLGKLNDAADHYRKALALDPGCEPARLNLQGLEP